MLFLPREERFGLIEYAFVLALIALVVIASGLLNAASSLNAA
jgi:Flp pilus assembly pilin Flp